MIKVTYEGKDRYFPNKMLFAVCMEIAEENTDAAHLICDEIVTNGGAEIVFDEEDSDAVLVTMTDDGMTKPVLKRMMRPVM